MTLRTLWRLSLVLATLLIGLGGPASAQQFPTKPITIIVPFGAGGVTDLFARQVAQKLEPILGQAVIVENRPGQGGSLGPRHVVNAEPDGYTLGLVGSGNTIGQTLYTNLTYSLMDDLVPVRNLVWLVNVLFVHPDVKANTVQEFIDLAKANPGKITMASSGAGGVYHLDMEMFKSMAGVDILHVPFRTEPEGRTDVIAGRSHGMISAYGVVSPNMKAGQVRILAVTSDERFAELPDVPTISEAALPGYNGDAFVGLMAPKGTPKPVIDKLHAAFTQAVNDPDFKASVAKQGMAIVADQTPEQFGQFLRDEIDKWAKVIEEAGVKKR